MPLCLHPLVALLLAFSPLSTTQQRDLATASDGGDHREPAFLALVEHVRHWIASPADDEAIRLSPDLASLLAAPADHRGDLCRITGELLQQAPLAPPYEDVSEWFVRDDRTGSPAIVYVVRPPAEPTFNDRQRVQIDGRFYKRMSFRARDGKTHEYAAFVGRFPAALPPVTQPRRSATPGPRQDWGGWGGRSLDLLAVIAGPVAVLAIVLVGMRLWIARQRRSQASDRSAHRPRWLPRAEADAVDDAAGLPDDPTAALAELRRRAEQIATDDARDQRQTSA